jgi:hypothetical protein
MADSEGKSTRAKVTAKQATDDGGNGGNGGGSDDTVEAPVGQLVDQSSEFLGYPSFVAAGALADQSPDDTMDVASAKAKIESWLQTPVQVDEEE